MAVSSTQEGLRPISFYAAAFTGRIAYHDFEGVTLYPEEGERLLRQIGDRQAVVLRNHGLLSWGLSLAQAFAILWTMQRACEVQCTMSPLAEPIPISDRVASQCSADALQFDQSYGAGQDMFDALCRQIDRIDESYKL